MSVFSATSLSKSFCAGGAYCSARARVLHGIDLTLWRGEVVALDGRNGCGKSTFLLCAAGLLRPEAGTLRWFGARVCPRDYVAYVGKVPARSSLAPLGRTELQLCDTSEDCGALYSSVERLFGRRARLVLIDDLPLVGVLERRLVLGLLERLARTGAAVLFVANPELATFPFVTRSLTLANGALVQRRKRSAARIAASSPDSRARASARSTYGRSLRSPQ